MWKRREIVKEVCDNLNHSTDKNIEISCTIWEDYPLIYTKNLQESIDELLVNADIYIVILWHRLGTSVEGVYRCYYGRAECYRYTV